MCSYFCSSKAAPVKVQLLGDDGEPSGLAQVQAAAGDEVARVEEVLAFLAL